jgi:hypothetical protein
LTTISEYGEPGVRLLLLKGNFNLVADSDNLWMVLWQVPKLSNDSRSVLDTLVICKPSRRLDKKWNDNQKVYRENDLQSNGKDPLKLRGSVGCAESGPVAEHKTKNDQGGFYGD